MTKHKFFSHAAHLVFLQLTVFIKLKNGIVGVDFAIISNMKKILLIFVVSLFVSFSTQAEVIEYTPLYEYDNDIVGHIYGIAIQDNTAYLLGNKLTYIELDSSEYPKIVDPSISLSLATDIEIYNNYAYVASYSPGITVYKVEDPTTPEETISQSTEGRVKNLDVENSYLFVADGDNGMLIFDISNPTTLTQVGHYEADGTAVDVIVKDNYAFLSHCTHGVKVIDVSDPTAPSLASYVGYLDADPYSSEESAQCSRGISIKDDYLFVAEAANGLTVYDISDPTNLTKITSYNSFTTTGFEDIPFIVDVATQNNKAYVADYETGFFVLDITDPTSPSQIGYYEISSRTESVAISGNYAYIGGSLGLVIIQIGTDEDVEETSDADADDAADSNNSSGNATDSSDTSTDSTSKSTGCSLNIY